ncbi:hypothetical protein SUNI508_06656 [Seiridium unicorne]|uniref:Ricin B lectin domain-containing protein n=1 Tax=Seiridium unicorne TaxID=138068 RepID=A0ABR2UZJ5_9PEZI
MRAPVISAISVGLACFFRCAVAYQLNATEWYQLQQAGNGSACIIIDPHASGVEAFPIRVESCSEAGDYSLWRSELSNNATTSGCFTFYNKGYPGSMRLNLARVGQYMVAGMSPSVDGYATQYWITTTENSNTLQISNHAFPGMYLAEVTINETNAVVLMSSSDVGSDAMRWIAADVEHAESPSPTSVEAGTGGSASPTINSGSPSSTLESTSSLLSTPASSGNDTNTSTMPLALGVSLGLGFLFLIGSGWLCWRLCGRRNQRQLKDETSQEKQPSSSPFNRSSTSVEHDPKVTSGEHDPKKWNFPVLLHNDMSTPVELEGLLDTACQEGDWISRRALERLGIFHKRRSVSKEVTVTGIDGEFVNPIGEIVLPWKAGDSDCSFEENTFLIAESPQFDVIIGDKTIQKYKMVQRMKGKSLPIFSYKNPNKAQRDQAAANARLQAERAAANDALFKEYKQQKKQKKDDKGDSQPGDSRST